MNAIESIREAAEAARLTAAADYVRLADALARGERPPADALDILTRAGRSADDLEQIVRVAAERQHLEPLAGRLNEILRQRVEAEGELKAVEEECSAERGRLENEHLNRINPLRVRVADLAEAERQSRDAKTRLQSLAARPEAARRHALVELGEG